MGWTENGRTSTGTMKPTTRDECVWIREELPWAGVKIEEARVRTDAGRLLTWYKVRVVIPASGDLLSYGLCYKVRSDYTHSMQEL